jgi:hypothetical protein
MANTCPNRIIDLQAAVEDRIATKNQLKQDARAVPPPASVCYTCGSHHVGTPGDEGGRERMAERYAQPAATPPFESEQDRDERKARQLLHDQRGDRDPHE